MNFGRYESPIDYIINNLTQDELKYFLVFHEDKILGKEINRALDVLQGKDTEELTEFKVVNESNHDVELHFTNLNFDTTSWVAITSENMHDPTRDCDCLVGANMGFCHHFWIGFMYSLKKGFFTLEEWTLTKIPQLLRKITKRSDN